MNSIQRSQQIRKIRENLYQLPYGQLVGFGPIESENGTSTCWNCHEADCEHVEAITQAWLDGMSVEAQTIPFNGIAPETDNDPDELIFASSADLWPDDYGIEEPTL